MDLDANILDQLTRLRIVATLIFWSFWFVLGFRALRLLWHTVGGKED